MNTVVYAIQCTGLSTVAVLFTVTVQFTVVPAIVHWTKSLILYNSLPSEANEGGNITLMSWNMRDSLLMKSAGIPTWQLVSPGSMRSRRSMELRQEEQEEQEEQGALAGGAVAGVAV